MKKQSPRRSSSPTPPIVVRHQLDHVVPTVIHHPEEKMTALGRLTHHVLQDPRKYSTWALTAAIGILAAVVIWNVTTGRRSRTSEVWSKLDNAKKAEDRVEIAKLYPNSPASTWALLQAATEYYNLALSDLPNNHDVALPYFSKAVDLFDQVAREAPKDSFQARAAALGKARALESRYDLRKAIEQYALVAETWPGSAEAEQAKQRAAALKKPDAAAFYKDLYAYVPTKVTLPSLGTESFTSPLSSPGAAAKPGSLPKSGLLPEMQLELSPPNVEELPDDVFATKPAGAAENRPQVRFVTEIASRGTLAPCGPPHFPTHRWNLRSNLDRKASESTLTWPTGSPTTPGGVLQKVIDADGVLVNARLVKACYRVRQGDQVCIRLPDLPDTTPEPEDIPLEVVL